MRTIAALSLALISTAASAQEQNLFFLNKAECLPSQQVFSILESEYNETPVIIGDSVVENSNNNSYAGIMILTATPDWSSHSVTISFEDGITCVLVRGDKLVPGSALQGDKI